MTETAMAGKIPMNEPKKTVESRTASSQIMEMSVPSESPILSFIEKAAPF